MTSLSGNGQSDAVFTTACVVEIQSLAGKDREWIKVYAEGKYGFVQDGKPVYTQYSDDVHCVDFRADPDLDLLLGFDAGLTPACIIAQISKRGQLRILDELISKDMDMYSLARDILKPHLAKYYPEIRSCLPWETSLTIS